MAEPTKADLEAKLAERDREIAATRAKAEAEIAELRAQLDSQPPPTAAPARAEPEGGPVTVDLPATRTPIGAEPYNADRPEVGQYVGHGATSIASSYGTYAVDPATGLITGRVT